MDGSPHICNIGLHSYATNFTLFHHYNFISWDNLTKSVETKGISNVKKLHTPGIKPETITCRHNTSNTQLKVTLTIALQTVQTSAQMFNTSIHRKHFQTNVSEWQTQQNTCLIPDYHHTARYRQIRCHNNKNNISGTKVVLIRNIDLQIMAWENYQHMKIFFNSLIYYYIFTHQYMNVLSAQQKHWSKLSLILH